MHSYITVTSVMIYVHHQQSTYQLTIDCLEMDNLTLVDNFCNNAKVTKQHKYYVPNSSYKCT